MNGVFRLRARLHRMAYSKHRHDTYTLALTESGVQEFTYRGEVYRSVPGQVVLLHPDEPHDGRPGPSCDSFAYRSLYIAPHVLRCALDTLAPRLQSLPFVPTPVHTDPQLRALLVRSFDGPLEPTLVDSMVTDIARHLCRLMNAQRCAPRLNANAVEKAREYLVAHSTRVVSSEELEGVTGLSRFDLCVQFRRQLGTSPYRFLLMRRLELVKDLLAGASSLSSLAQDMGFADQAHMTRSFRSAFGLSPSEFLALKRARTVA